MGQLRRQDPSLVRALTPDACPSAGHFVFEAQTGRVVFGPGRRQELGAEVAHLGATKVFLIAGPHERAAADEAAHSLGHRVAGRWDEVRQHVPVALVDKALADPACQQADVLVSLGGGSAIGLAKAIAVSKSLPVLAVPTTYSGSEMTPIWGTTSLERKTTGRDVKALPKTVIYDPELTISLPIRLSATTGINALAHCVEALYAPGANPVTSLLALEGAHALFANLPQLQSEPADVGGRSGALYGAFLAGSALAGAGTSVHHRICHILGGRYDLSHSELHTALLGRSVALVEQRTPGLLASLAAAMGAPTATSGIDQLVKQLVGPVSLARLGVSRDQVYAVLPDIVASGAAEPWASTHDEVSAFVESLTRD